ncbi:MAG: FkbM family methyltransferase [Devosia sp.]
MTPDPSALATVSSAPDAYRTRYARQLGIDIPIDPEVMSWLIRFELWRGNYEAKEARMLDRLITAGERVLELGTGIGFVSTVIARNPNVSRLVTYEANPRLAPFIRRLASSNLGAAIGKVEFRNAVLFNNPASSHTDFYVSRHFWGSSLLPVSNPVSVERVRVDDFAKVAAEFRPSLVVCDIEGGELELFRNADLEGVDKVYLELHPFKLGLRGIREVHENFARHGFAKDPRYSRRWVVLFRRIGA